MGTSNSATPGGENDRLLISIYPYIVSFVVCGDDGTVQTALVKAELVVVGSR